jgi:hypothetical protein
MTNAVDWGNAASALRELHRALLDCARRDYEREQSRRLSAGQLLQLVTTDPFFGWLRSLSELIVDIDIVRDAEPALMDELASALRPAIEHLISTPARAQAAGPFAEHYWRYVQDDPHVAIAHVAVKQALESWPKPAETDTAALLHERHRLAERARHLR